MDPTFGNLTIMKVHTFCLKQVFAKNKYSEDFKVLDENINTCINNVYNQY